MGVVLKNFKYFACNFLFLIGVFLCLGFFSLSCVVYPTEETEIYNVDQYKVHDTGVEVWANNQSGDYGFFFTEKDIFSTQETSRVILIRNAYDNAFSRSYGDVKGCYLYLNEEEFKDYLEKRSNINE